LHKGLDDSRPEGVSEESEGYAMGLFNTKAAEIVVLPVLGRSELLGMKT
jgi:hypothetical protein